MDLAAARQQELEVVVVVQQSLVGEQIVPTRNALWHKYEVEIDALEEKKITVLQELKVGEEEEEEEEEKV